MNWRYQIYYINNRGAVFNGKNQNNHYVPGKKIFLYVVNIVIFALLILLFISFWASGEILTGFIACAALEFLFLFGSIIVYHLSIISDVMTKQNERAEKDRQQRENESKN